MPKYSIRYLQKMSNETWKRVRDEEEQVMCAQLKKIFKQIKKEYPQFTHTLDEVFMNMSINDDDIFFSLTNDYED